MGKIKVPILIAFDDNYAPFGACVVKSALLNKSDKYLFSFYILHEGLTLATQTSLQEMIAEYSDAEMHFLDVSNYFASMSLHLHTIYSRATYYRLAIPDLLPEANRAIYLDSDLIINDDLSELFDWDLQGKSLAASLDVLMNSLVITSGLTNRESGSVPVRRYFSQILGLPDPELYYQAGVMIMDLVRLRNLNKLPKMLELAGSNQYWMADQDIINSLFVDDIVTLPQRWNLLTGGGEYQSFLANISGTLQDEYRNARSNPAIIHYASYTKPWIYSDIDFASYFWKVLQKTPYDSLVFDWLQQGKIKSVKTLPFQLLWRDVLICLFEKCFPKGSKLRTAIIYINRKIFK